MGAAGGEVGSNLFLQIGQQAVRVCGNGIENQRGGLVWSVAADEVLAGVCMGRCIHRARSSFHQRRMSWLRKW